MRFHGSSATLVGMRWTWSRGQRLGAIALVPASLCFIALRWASSPDIAFISRGSEPWVMAPTPVSASSSSQWGSDAVPATRFARQFQVASRDAPIVADSGPARVSPQR